MRADCAHILPEGDDQQTVWPRDPGAEGEQAGRTGAEHPGGGDNSPGQEQRVPVRAAPSHFTIYTQCSVESGPAALCDSKASYSINLEIGVHRCLSREFVRTAWGDIERFKEQKNKDLREALVSYAIMQISMCKKVKLSPSVLTVQCAILHVCVCASASHSRTSSSLAWLLSQGIQVWSNAKECFSKM